MYRTCRGALIIFVRRIFVSVRNSFCLIFLQLGCERCTFCLSVRVREVIIFGSKISIICNAILRSENMYSVRRCAQLAERRVLRLRARALRRRAGVHATATERHQSHIIN